MSSSSAEEEKPHKCLKRVEKSIHYKNKLKKRIKVAKKEEKSLRHEIDAFKSKAEKLTQEATVRLEFLKKNATDKEVALANLKKQFAAAGAELQYTQSLHDSRVAEWTTSNSSLTKLETDLANTLAELKQVRAEEHDVDAHEKYLQELANKEAQEIAALQAQQAKEAAETEALNQKANEDRAKLHQVDDELKKADVELADLNRQIKEKEIEIEHLGGHVEEIVRRKIPPTHSEWSTHQNLVDGKGVLVQKVVTDLGVVLEKIPLETGERADLLKIYDTHTMSLSQLRERIAVLEHDIADITHTKQALQTSYTQVTEAHKVELEHLEAANASYSEKSSKLKVARKENDAIFQEVNELKQKIKALAAEEAQTEAAEAELKAKEAAEAAEILALRVKEKEEREAIVALKASILAARQTLQQHETQISGHKQTLEKVTEDLSSLNTSISTREIEISGVLEEHASTHKLYIETSGNIDVSQKRVQELEYHEASLAHLQGDLDEKIKELAHKEATEHHELEANGAKLGVLANELDHLRGEIVKANFTLGSKQKHYESKVAAAEIDIKHHDAELVHHAEVHKHKEKDVLFFTAKVDKHKRHHHDKKHHEKKKKEKHHHHKKHSSSSSSSSD